MLIAKFNDHYVNASNARQGEKYYCPECGEELILRKGKTKIAHFAHYSKSKCLFGEGETYEHLLGKQQIFEWAREHGWDAELEVYIAELNQRADIIITIKEKQFVIEFQCSPLSERKLAERTRGYRKIGLNCIWLLGSRYFGKQSQRQTQKFLQFLNHRYLLAFWNTKKGQVNLVRPFIRMKPATIKTINQDYRILQKQRLLMHQGTTLPLICHHRITGLHFTNYQEILWRYQVCLWLTDIPIFTSFTKTQWFQYLREINSTGWETFPCLQPFSITNVYLKLFTKQLVMDGIIKISYQRVIILKHPEWGLSLEKQYNKIDRERKRTILVDINKV